MPGLGRTIEKRLEAAVALTRATGRRPADLDELLLEGCTWLHEIEIRLLQLGRQADELLSTEAGARRLPPILAEQIALEGRLFRLRADLQELQRSRRTLHVA
jgi:hypothetical protein